jgi:large subunit ribosomal protein L23
VKKLFLHYNKDLQQENNVNPYNVLLRPLLSEKNNELRESKNKYVFKVDFDSTKGEIKDAVSKMFDVKVANVRTVVCRGKVRRRGVNVGQSQHTKKAIITLQEGQSIKKIFEDQ